MEILKKRERFHFLYIDIMKLIFIEIVKDSMIISLMSRFTFKKESDNKDESSLRPMMTGMGDSSI